METIILGILIVVLIVGWLVTRYFKPHMPELQKLEIDEGAKELKLFGDMAQLAAYEQLGLLPKDIMLIGNTIECIVKYLDDANKTNMCDDCKWTKERLLEILMIMKPGEYMGGKKQWYINGN